MQNESIYSPLIEMEDILDRDITLEEAIQVLVESYNENKKTNHWKGAVGGAAVAGLGYGASKISKDGNFKGLLYKSIKGVKDTASTGKYERELANINQKYDNFIDKIKPTHTAAKELLHAKGENTVSSLRATDAIAKGMHDYGPYVAGAAGAYAGYKAIRGILNMLNKKKQQAISKGQDTRQIDAEIARVKAKAAKAR